MQPASNSGSTLELVVNEQQMQNMSQIDLRPSPAEGNEQTTAKLNHYLAQAAAGQQQQRQQQQQRGQASMFSLEELRSWPARLRENFHSKLDSAKAKSETRTEYAIEIVRTFSGIVVWVLCFLCTIVLPIILLLIGLVNLDDCSDRPSLPYLVVAIGFFMTASNLFNLALALNVPVLANHQLLSNDVKNIIASIVNIIFNSLVAFLYVLTAYMVFNIRGGRPESSASQTVPPPDELSQVQCDTTLYNVTFWFVTLTLSAFLLLSTVALLLFAYNRYRLAIIRGSTPRSHQTTNSTAAPATNGNQTQPNYSASANRL